MPIKAWTKGVAIETVAEKQLRNVAAMPFVFKWVAAMPDVHWDRCNGTDTVIRRLHGLAIPKVGATLQLDNPAPLHDARKVHDLISIDRTYLGHRAPRFHS